MHTTGRTTQMLNITSRRIMFGKVKNGFSVNVGPAVKWPVMVMENEGVKLTRHESK